MKVLSAILWKIRSVLQMKHGGFKWFTVVSEYLSYIMVVSYIGEGNWSKSLTKFIT
jgi:hypothetical protein